MLHVVATTEFLGLNKERYQYETLQMLADSLEKIHPNVDFNLSRQMEVGLTHSFLQIALHLDHGMFADTIHGINSNFHASGKEYAKLLNDVPRDSISRILSGLEPNNRQYNRFMKALREFVSRNNISSTPIFIRNPKTDSAGAVEDTRRALVYHHYLSDTLRNSDSAYRTALKKFQLDNNLNGDGTVGANTIKALERDNARKFQLLSINADRWRKEHVEQLPAAYVWVNLPSYRLKIIVDDSVKMEKRVVIGKATERAETPILESAINQIVLWPTWTVPQSIIKREMKSFKGFQVTKRGNGITVVQPAGLKNALGAVKILFPNKYSVYIHDTPAKTLFNADLRAASHGCVRCQEPLEVAAYLLQLDSIGISYDSLKAIKDRKIQTRTFRLKKPVPVYFRYFTAEADQNGNLRFYADVYNRDRAMIDFIFKPAAARVQPLSIKPDSIARKKNVDTSRFALKLNEKKLLPDEGSENHSSMDTTSARHDSL
jgi:murein L,D-transpeptidase YcbB/YkuD